MNIPLIPIRIYAAWSSNQVTAKNVNITEMHALLLSKQWTVRQPINLFVNKTDPPYKIIYLELFTFVFKTPIVSLQIR